MKKSRQSLSQGKTYAEIGQFWDTHDLASSWEQTEDTDFAVDIQSEVVYYAIDKCLSQQLQVLAQKRGITPDTLANLLLQERLHESPL